MTHDIEIEKRFPDKPAREQEYRASCTCGFPGPWRKTRRTAVRDGDAHEDRCAAGER